jgi:hypothetical protein
LDQRLGRPVAIKLMRVIELRHRPRLAAEALESHGVGWVVSVLYEMLVGETPFQAETPVAVALKHVRDPLPDVRARRPEVCAALAAVVERSTAKRPSDRYATVDALLDISSTCSRYRPLVPGGASARTRWRIRR